MKSLWQNAGFVKLGVQEKLAVLYFLAGPQANEIGLYKVSFQQMSTDLGIEIDPAVNLARSVWRLGRWEFDDIARVLWIPSWWQWFPCESDGKFRKLLAGVKAVPSTDLKARFLAHGVHLPEVQRGLLRQAEAGVSLKKRAVVSASSGSTDLFGGPVAASADEPSALAYQIVLAWNSIVTAPIPQVSRLTHKLRDKIYARLRTFTDVSDYRAVFQMLAVSPWFRGEKQDVTAYKDWVGDLAWIMHDDERFQRQLDKARVVRPDVPISRPANCQHAPFCHSVAACTQRTLKDMGV